MFTTLDPSSTYKPHPDGISVISGDGVLVARIAWWSDDPVRDGIGEARTVVAWYHKRGIDVTRIVLDRSGNELFRCSGEDL
jgi:hypothetical protein